MSLPKWLACAAIAALALPAAAQNEAPGKEERKDYDCDGSKLVVWTVQDYEEQHVIVWLLDSAGKQTRPNITAPGTFIPLCRHGVFLLLDDTGAHFQPGPSWLVSAKGEILGRYTFGYEAEHGVTGDEQLVWVQSFEGHNEEWRTRLWVLDAHGATVHNQLYNAATRQKVEYDGQTYTIDVRKPDFPF